MVNQVGYSEQWMLLNRDEKRKAQNLNPTIIMVHNLSHLFRREDFEKAKHAICELYITQGLSLENFSDVDVLLEPSNSSVSSRIHVFMAQQCEELRFENERTI